MLLLLRLPRAPRRARRRRRLSRSSTGSCSRSWSRCSRPRGTQRRAGAEVEAEVEAAEAAGRATQALPEQRRSLLRRLLLLRSERDRLRLPPLLLQRRRQLVGRPLPSLSLPLQLRESFAGRSRPLSTRRKWRQQRRRLQQPSRNKTDRAMTTMTTAPSRRRRRSRRRRASSSCGGRGRGALLLRGRDPRPCPRRRASRRRSWSARRAPEWGLLPLPPRRLLLRRRQTSRERREQQQQQQERENRPCSSPLPRKASSSAG